MRKIRSFMVSLCSWHSVPLFVVGFLFFNFVLQGRAEVLVELMVPVGCGVVRPFSAPNIHRVVEIMVVGNLIVLLYAVISPAISRRTIGESELWSSFAILLALSGSFMFLYSCLCMCNRLSIVSMGDGPDRRVYFTDLPIVEFMLVSLVFSLFIGWCLFSMGQRRAKASLRGLETARGEEMANRQDAKDAK